MRPSTSRLFLLNGIFNVLGAVILVFGADRLSSALHLGTQADFLWHLLGACSLTLAVLSFYAGSFDEKKSTHAAVVTFMTFHGLAALVSIWAIADGIGVVVWGNTAIHLVFFVAFWYFGLRVPALVEVD
jgi:hypothetical protein